MLSNKMTFSLMSLITIIALVFVTPSAMAGEFDVTLDGTEDVSAAADFQMDHPGTSLVVAIKSGQAIALPAANVFVTTYDEDGNVLDFPTAVVAPVSPLANKELTLTIPVTAAVAKVNIKIAKGIGSADPINADTSKALDATIFLVDADDAGLPTVYSIRRADNPLLPATAATVQVIVTLSEMPKEFKKGNLSISDNATIADPAALDPVPEDPARFRVLSAALGRTSTAAAPPLRSLYDDLTRDGSLLEDDDTTDDVDESEGIHAALIADTPMALADALADYNEAVTAYNAVVGTDADAIADPLTDSELVATQGATYEIMLHRPLMTFNIATGNDITYPTVGALEDDADADAIEEVIAAADNFPLMRNVAPTQPTAADGADALALYTVLKEVYDLYMAEMALHSAYMAAVMAEMDADDDALSDYFAVGLGELVPDATGRDDMLHPYVVTITPKYPAGKADIVLKIGAWEDTTLPISNKYVPPATDAEFDEGVTKLTIKVGKEVLKPGTAGTEVVLGKEHFIPKDGYLVVVDDAAGSAVINPGGAKDAPPVTRSPAGQEYNVHSSKSLPNLEGFLLNGGTIDVVSPLDLTITEIMWGTDASLVDDNSKSQWIELLNSGAGANTADDDANTAADEATRLIFYGPNETPPALVAGALPAGVKDRVGGFVPSDLIGRGQNGRSGVGEEKADLTALVPTQALISMRRVMDATGDAADGTLAASWMASGTASTGLGVNFDPNVIGRRVGTPGAVHLPSSAETTADAAAAQKKIDDAAAAQKKIDSTGTIPKVGQIYISEVMFAGGGILPQWIEISNGSRSEEVNLSGWTITVDNAVADADVSVGATATFTIPEGTKIDPSGQNDTPSTILVVTEKGRNNLTGADASGQVLNLSADNEVELILAGVVTGKYTLISEMAFMITLAPPEPAATTPPTGETITAKATRQAAEKKATLERKAATDMAGNLGTDGAAAWALPMDDSGARSSIIRKHVQVARGPAAPEKGTMMDSWALASETSFAQVTHIRASSYYGAANDVGTPGFRAGGALPVELSHFSPARDKVTDAVVITWSTQSELNNAGFFIKRSQQRDGEFKVINAAMIPGAGTTSEKQFYTYSDTTAQPNVVYYYQIEDVSLDGNRQTLTRGIRLKGHVGAAGKATTTWGDLKTSNE